MYVQSEICYAVVKYERIGLLILFILQWTQTSASIFADISHSVAEKNNLLCVEVRHRPKSITGLNIVMAWLKTRNDNSWRTIGASALIDRMPHYAEIRCLHVLDGQYATPKLFTQLTETTNLHQTFWLIFLNSSTSIENFLSNALLPFSLELMVVHLLSLNEAHVFDVWRVNSNHPLRMLPIGHWTSEEGLQIDDKSVYKRRTDLEGIQLKVGLLENWPISFQVKRGNTIEWDGFFPKIWKQIEESINVSSSILIRYTSTGSPRQDGTWSGLIGMAVRGEIDVIVSELSMNERRSRVLDFSHPLLTSKYQIFFKQPGIILDWMAVFRPFPVNLWQAISLWVIMVSISHYFCACICRKYGLEKRPHPVYGVLNHIFLTLQSLSQQGREDPPRATSLRILFFSSYLVSAVVIPSYSASLISSLTQKTPYRPFNSVREMLRDGTYNLLVANNTAEFDYFADTKDATLSRAYNQHIATVPVKNRMTTMRQAFNTVCTEPKYALFGVEAIITQRQFQAPCQIISMTRPLSSVHLGMALPKNHHLHPLINYHFSLLIETGILSRLEANTWPKDILPTVSAWSQVRAEEVFQIFAFLASAILFSGLILIGEKIIYWQLNKANVVPFYLEYQFVN